MPIEDPKSITAISQPHNLDEYEYKSYEELSKEFQEVYPAAARAFVLIPQMYNRLTLVDGLTHKHALEKIRNDHYHLPGFTQRNIRRYLPANNPNIPRRVRTSCPKNSVTETSVGTFFSDTKHNERNINHKIGTQSISNHVVKDISSDRTVQIEDVTSKRQIKSDSGECPRCQGLEEELRKATNLSTVDTIPTAANNSNKADLKTTSNFPVERTWYRNSTETRIQTRMNRRTTCQTEGCIIIYIGNCKACNPEEGGDETGKTREDRCCL